MSRSGCPNGVSTPSHDSPPFIPIPYFGVPITAHGGQPATSHAHALGSGQHQAQRMELTACSVPDQRLQIIGASGRSCAVAHRARIGRPRQHPVHGRISPVEARGTTEIVCCYCIRTVPSGGCGIGISPSTTTGDEHGEYQAFLVQGVRKLVPDRRRK
jgi:hypothetical protein